MLAIGDRIEKNAIIRAKTEIPTFIRNAIDKSFSDGVKRTVKVNTTGGAIIITKNTSPSSIELYEIGRPLTIIMTPSKFDIGEKGEVTGLGAATQAAVMVNTKKGNKVVRVEVSNISGLNLGRVNVIKY